MNRKYRKMSDPVVDNVLRKNPYAILKDKNINVDNNTHKINKSPDIPTVKTSTPPPIIVHNIDITTLKNKLQLFSQYNDITLQSTMSGTKLFVQSTEQYKQLKTFCIDNQLKFHSHLLKEEQKIKIVIHGLHDMEINDLFEELSYKEIFPCDIKKLEIFKRRYDNQCIFLLYFKKIEGIKIANLRNIKSLFQMIIKWDYYHARKTGPTQCNNCMQFGHGAESCFLDPKCIRCGDEHKSRDCHLLNDPNDTKSKIPDDKVKCANCGDQHTANFNKCTKRMEYINLKNKIRIKNTPNSKPSNYQFKDAPQLNNSNFPNINKTRKEHQSVAWGLNKSSISPNGARNHDPGNSNNLLTTEELMSAFRELMEKLQSAKTRYEQITALGEVAIKYSSDVSP